MTVFPLFDAHCDTLFAMRESGQALGRNTLHVDLCRGQRYTPRAQFFAIFDEIAPVNWSQFEAQYALFLQSQAEHAAAMQFCRTAHDAKSAARLGKLAAFLSVEGADLLDCSPARLTEAYNLGVRMLTLTWNTANALSGSHMDDAARGLSRLGREFVQTCARLGVIVDVSHLSERGFWDVAEEMNTLLVPFIASHSNSAAVHPHSRNLTDAQFRALTYAGGVAGINLYSDFLSEEPDIDTVILHIEHFLSLDPAASRTIAIGADFDGCAALPRGIRGMQDIERIAERLLQKNYTDALVCDILYHNLMRVVEIVCIM